MVGFRRKRCAPLHAQACSGPCGPRSDEWWRAPILNQLLEAFAAAEDLGVAFHSAQLAASLAFPGFGAPTARRVNGRFFREHRRGNWRGRNEKRPHRHGDDGSRRGVGQAGRARRSGSRGHDELRRRIVIGEGGWRSQAGVDRRALGFRIQALRTGSRSGGPPRDGAGHEFVHQLVQAGLAAQVLGAGPQTVPRVPTADAQLARQLARRRTNGWSVSFPLRKCRTKWPGGSPAPPVPLPDAVAALAGIANRASYGVRTAQSRDPCGYQVLHRSDGLRVERAGPGIVAVLNSGTAAAGRFQFGTVRR